MIKLWDGFIWVVVGAIMAWIIYDAWVNAQRNIELAQHNADIVKQLLEFKSAGARFTAQNGDDLCQSVQELQRQAGLLVRECAFGTSK